MKTPKRQRKTTPPPLFMAELMFSSWETIARRSLMMAQGTCTAAEYARMSQEKADAAISSGFAMARGASAAAVLGPWHRAASANAKRLRKK